MKVTPNSTMVAPQDDLDLNLVTSRIKRFLTNAVENLYKKVDHKNRHATKKEEVDIEAHLIIKVNENTHIVADSNKSGLYFTKLKKMTSQKCNFKAAKSNGKNKRSPDMKKTKSARQQQQENINKLIKKRTSQKSNSKAAKSNRKNTRSPAKKKTKPARQKKQEDTNFNFANNCPDCKFAQK